MSLAELENDVEAIDERWRRALVSTYKVEAVKAAALGRAETGIETHVPADAAASAVIAEVLPSDSAAHSERGVAWGEDMHSLLEAAMRSPGADLESLARSLSRAREGEEDEDRRVQELLGSVEKVTRSQIWKRARASQRALAEVPLTILADDAGEPSSALPTIQRGAIDLAFLEPKGWVIVDYKTDRVDKNSIAKKVEYYRPQVASYKKVWERVVFPEQVHEVGLYFIYLDRYERISG